jgi:glycosyltransferase involved in cell wall biosynthesis
MTETGGASQTSRRRVALVWDNFGPQHIDRLNALTERFKAAYGVQLYPQSNDYAWSWSPEPKAKLLTLCRRRKRPLTNTFLVLVRMIGLRIFRGVDVWLMCHYERPYIFVASLLLQVLGAKVLLLNDSKLDDYPRRLSMELFKALLYVPYEGGMGPGARTIDYMRFLGVKGPKRPGYDTGSVARLRTYLPTNETPFEARAFLWVGRFIEKKNVAMLVEAYADYVAGAGAAPRRLILVGQGPERAKVEAAVAARGVAHLVAFIDWADQPTVIGIMARALYLMLPSLSEQFGNVVGEAAAAGIPSLVSANAGVCDVVTVDFVSGFTLPPDNRAAWAAAMAHVAQDKPLWERLSRGAWAAADNFDSANFAAAAVALAHARS